MDVKRTRFWVCLAAISLAGVIALAAVNVFSPAEIIEIPADAPYVPAEYVYVTPSGTKYHRMDCSAIASSKSLDCLTPGEAAEREYEPCRVCEP